MAGRRVGGNKGTTTNSTVQTWEQGWIRSAVTQAHPLTLAFRERFLVSEYDGHSAVCEGEHRHT